MNLAEIRAHTFARCGWDASNPGVAVTARIDGFINETYRQIMARKGLETLRRHIINWGSTPSRSMTTMPMAITRIYNLWDTTNGTLLSNLSTRDIRRADPTWSPANQGGSPGTPMGYAVYNLAAAAYQQPWETFPASGSPLFVGSTSALDGATVHANVQGVDTAGNPVVAQLPLNGTTVVGPFVTYQNWAIITKFFLSSVSDPMVTVPVAQGRIFLWSAISGAPPAQQMSFITVGRKSAHFSAINLYPTPASQVALSADCDIIAEDLVVAGDVPILPYDFHSLLVLGAAIKEFGRREKSQQLVDLRREANDLLADLMIYANRQVSDARPFQRYPQYGYSALGSMFPAGS